MGISETGNCPYCDEPEESIEHAFLYCETVKAFWGEVENWLKRYIDNSIKISEVEKIMGTGVLNDIVDKTLIATKRVIYRNRQIGRPYTLQEVKALLRNQMLLEEYQSSIEGTDETFLKSWETLYRFIY